MIKDTIPTLEPHSFVVVDSVLSNMALSDTLTIGRIERFEGDNAIVRIIDYRKPSVTVNIPVRDLRGVCPTPWQYTDGPVLDGDDVEELLLPAMWVMVARVRRPKLPFMTDWFDGRVAPSLIGWYERCFITSADNQSERCMHYWDGRYWRKAPLAPEHYCQVGDYPSWRGLAADPTSVPTIGLFWDRFGPWFNRPLADSDVL